MKKLSLTIFIIGSLLAIAPLHAQRNSFSCDFINSGNYFDCCTAPINGAVASRCSQYENDQFCNDFPQECQTAPGQVGGGGSVPTGPINTGTGSNDVIISTPQSSTIELSSCNAIRFKSVLDILIWLKCAIVAAVIPIIFVLAFVFFLWGVFKFMTTTDPTKRKESKKLIWWGIVGLFVMVSVWGIIRILGNTLGIESTVPLLQTEYLDPKKASQ